MSDEIFDQERPRSTMARRLDEAFAGCDEWTTAPPTPRRSDPDLAPWLAGPSRMIDRAASARLPEQRAA
jgi:hypothetical protein